MGDSARRSATSYPAPVIGTLQTAPALDRPELLADPVTRALKDLQLADVHVAEIDPTDADTAAFCERYGVALDQSANCVVVAGRRGADTRLAACVVLANARADEWLLYDQVSPSASAARGFATGRLFTTDGRLVASVAQEGLIRLRKR
ncbi:MAG: hypothetical protein QOH75_2490 [Actinomycetota bacterium]|nr:hypothetical protein [Actinomycetota bacterium]